MKAKPRTEETANGAAAADAEPLEAADGLDEPERARLKAEKNAAKKEKKVQSLSAGCAWHGDRAACDSKDVGRFVGPGFLCCPAQTVPSVSTTAQEKKRLKKEKKAATKAEAVDADAGPTAGGGNASGSEDSDADARKRAVEADLRQAALRSLSQTE